MADEPELIQLTTENGLTRRRFLAAAGTTAVGAVAFTGCMPWGPPDREYQAQSRVNVSEDTLTAFENWYATGCRQCDAGCGVIVRVVEGRSKKIEGNPDHPVNRGKLCARGQAGVQEQYHPDRIQGPLKRSGNRGSGAYQPISWDAALKELADTLQAARGQAGQIALFTSSLRAHQHTVADSFARAIGAQRLILDPLGEAPLREAVRRVYGQDVLPDFDIQNARYVLSFGADFLGPWLSQVHYSMAYGIFRSGNYAAGRFQPRRTGSPRGYLVQVDPHFSMTAANADEWVPIQPGGEGLLALSMAQVITSERLGDASAVSAIGSGLDAYRPETVAPKIGVTAARIQQLARDFASRRPALAIGGGVAAAHTNGTETMAAVLALNALVGSVGRSGGVQFNPASPIDGLSAGVSGSKLSDWQGMAERLGRGQVQVVLVHDTNPVYSLPGALRFREALASAPYVVSFSSFMDETTVMADLILPLHTQLEDWGDDVPNPGPGVQVLTLQQPIVQPMYDTRSVWDVLISVGQMLGGSVQQALPWPTFRDLLRQDARTLQQQGRGSVRDADFERFWTKMLQQGGWWDESRTGAAGQTPSISNVVSGYKLATFSPGSDQEYPLNLVVFPHNTLGAGETAHLPWLQAAPDPVTSATWQTWVELNPAMAKSMSLREGDIVRVESPNGSVEVPVYIHPAAPPTVLAMPMGQGHTGFGRWAQQRGANPMVLLAPLADEATGAVAYAATRVRLSVTGRHMPLPKFEGNVEAVQIPELEVAKVTRTV
ncbi:MAG: molybdopterin oxidoreductase [Chloroflexi bacterium]|nr:molybdopterin oxidoreductase [Chloroflexota bacterium]